VTKLQDVYGVFDPQHDAAAAIKFAVIVMLMDRRLRDLSQLLTDGHEVATIGGEPGWEIERRDENVADASYYADWPRDARFRVRIDPEEYSLAYPEMFLDKPSFYNYIKKALNVYVAENSSEAEEFKKISSLLL